jgi:hypothetical protein
VDVLATSRRDGWDGVAAWFENDGQGTFGLTSRHVIASDLDLSTVARARTFDPDLDGDPDLLTASYVGGIAWMENTGAGDFGPPRPISPAETTSNKPATMDMDEDGLDDIVAQLLSHEVVWHRNLGDGSFATAQVLIAATADHRVAT